MIKLFIVLICTFLTLTDCIGQYLSPKKQNGYIIQPIQLESNSLDSIVIEAEFQKFFINIKINNQKKENITIDWDKSVIIKNEESCTIMFAPSSPQTNNAPKGTVTIRPATHIEKLIFPSASLGKNGFLPILNKSEIKKNGPQIFDFVFHIIWNNKQKEYKVRYKISIDK